jgi:DNA-binding SARP family transcriptional activator
MSQLKLFLLGTPRVECGGAPIEVDTRKAIALLAYLAVTRRAHSRDALATLLWPEHDQTRARAVLRRTLSALNKALDGDWLDADRESIGLRRNPGVGGGGEQIWIDADQFAERLAACRAHGHPPSEVCARCLAPLAEAAALYRDDFMAGFSLRDSPNFDDWQFFQAESLRRDLASALERLMRGYSAQGDFEPAIGYARRWLSLDSLHEPAYRHLMELYAWAGQRGAALHQYRECVRILEHELGVAPLEETTRLYQAIKENQAPPPPTQNREPPRGHPTENQPGSVIPNPLPVGDMQPATDYGQHQEYPLVGRAAEWAVLNEFYAGIGENGRVIVLEGEGGIGKTRLAEEFLAHARARGAATIAARCYEGESGLAYSPFMAVLRAALRQPRAADGLAGLPAHWLNEAARLLPDLATLRPDLPPALPLDGPGAQSRFFEGVSQILLAAAHSARPGVLFFDDLQWADAASLDLLAYLVRRLRGQPVLLLQAWRSEQAATGNRLRRMLAGELRDGAAKILPLARLSRSAVQELVRSVAANGLALPDTINEQLHRETEGLPLFLVEYLNALTAEGAQDWSLPSGARDLLRARLAAVSETGWQLLTTAAAIGRSFDFDTLRAASGRGDEETVAGLEALIGQGLVVEARNAEIRDWRLEIALSSPISNLQSLSSSPVYDFSHEKLRALVYEETSLARRRLLHRRVAEALAGHGRNPHELGALAGQIAHHYRLAGQESLAAEYFKLAGEHARALYANTEALAHFRAALALGHPAAAALYTAIGDLQTLTGEYGAALMSYETAAALCDPDALAEIERKLGQIHDRRGEWDLADSHVRAALAALGDSAESGMESVVRTPLSVATSQEQQTKDYGLRATERARLYADWSLIAYHRGQTGRALELGHQALALAEGAGDTRTLAQVHNILGILGRSQGDLDNASHHLALSLALAETLDDPGIRVAALNNLALARGASDDIAGALKLAETALALCVSQGDRHREAALHNNLSDLLYAAGQPDAAMAHLKRAVSIFAEIGLESGDIQPEIWKLVEW